MARPKETWRKITKNSDHPVQQVRLACDMSQLTFASQIGYSESYLSAVESREKEKSSKEMRARIYQRFGALILSDHEPARAFSSKGDGLELYTSASFEEHKRSYKPGWQAFLSEDVVEVYNSLLEAALLKGREMSYDPLLLTVQLHLQAEARSTVKKFGLREQLRKKIRELRDSPIEKNIRLCYLLCELTDSRDYEATLRPLPEIERLWTKGITVGGKPATIGEWFESHGYPSA